MKTKTIISILAAMSASVATYAAASDVPVLPTDNANVVKYVSGNWSTSLPTIGTWSRWDAATSTWIGTTGSSAQPQSNEIVYIGDHTNGGFGVFQFESGSKSTTVDSIFIENTEVVTGNRTIELKLACVGNYNTPSLKTSNDFVVRNTSTAAALTVNVIPRGSLYNSGVLQSYRISNFEIGGNVYVGDEGALKGTTLNFGTAGDKTMDGKGPLSKLKIGGDIYVREYTDISNKINFNVGVGYYADLKGGILYDLNNPDVEIVGAIHVVGNSRSFFNPMLNKNGKARVTTFSVGGFDGNFSFILNSGTPTDYNEGENINYFVLAFTQDKEVSFTHNTNTSLNGSGISENGNNDFDAGNMMKIIMNGEGTQILQSNILRFHGGVQVNKGKLILNSKADGANGIAFDKTTVWSHGDLEINGGTFGLSNITSSGGEFLFTNCYWKSGTIVLGTYDTSVDVLKFTGSFAEGEGTISDVVFSFEGDCAALLNEMKIIDCSDFTSFVEEDFKADNVTIFGEEYEAIFKIKTDGLYVQYVAVPEPAAIAALLGAFAIGLAIVRRRK